MSIKNNVFLAPEESDSLKTVVIVENPDETILTANESNGVQIIDNTYSSFAL